VTEPAYTEAEIRAAMKHHRPGNEGYCVCAWGIENSPDTVFDEDHLIDLLRAAREAQQR